MQFVKSKLKCHDCIKPLSRRLGLFQVGDEYECYAESYVKCFWSLCDQHKSLESFIPASNEKVVTTQPLSNYSEKNNIGTAPLKDLVVLKKYH